MHKINLAQLLLLLSILTACKLQVKDKTPQKPNIVYILADDLGYGDVGFNGQTKFKTPNIDKLAADGMVFTQHYAGSTVCAPSRSALLTGLHTGHTPIRGNLSAGSEGQHPMPQETYTLSELLKDNGYVTAAYGKWGLGYPGSEGDPNRQGFDEFYGYNCQRLAHHYYPYHLWHNQEKVMLKANAGKQQNEYAPALIHQEALNFIQKNKDTTFFMYYASLLPHAELLVTQEDLKKYQGQFLPEKKYQGMDDGAKYRQGSYGSQNECYATFAAMVDILDRQVGELRSKLEESGIAENTIIIFTSDNGPHKEGGAAPEYFNSNGPYKGLKRDLYEGGIHVPMTVHWPAVVRPGSTSDHISSFWDVMPTMADVIKAEQHFETDGISFLPTLLGAKEQKQHEYLYWEFHEKGGRLAVRMNNWKGVKYNILKALDASIELYDLSTDPGETTNVAQMHPEVVATIQKIMNEARTESTIYKFKAPTFLNVN